MMIDSLQKRRDKLLKDLREVERRIDYYNDIKQIQETERQIARASTPLEKMSLQAVLDVKKARLRV